MKSTRRKFIKRTFLATLGAGFLTGIYAWQIEPRWLEFVKLKMPTPNIPNELKGKTLMQISDLHVGNRFDYKFLVKSLDEAKSYKPDFVVYTGDFISLVNGKPDLEKLREVCGHLVHGTLGTAAILGNHDYGVNWAQPEVAQQIVDELEKVGIPVLRNESIELAGLNIIGVDDLWANQCDLDKALMNLDAAQANLILAHNPDICDLAGWKDFAGWILSGHTHGGQVKPPFLNPPMLPVKNKRYSAGEINLDDKRTLYINRALGHLWQVRFNVRPEITIFELA
jgi:predicted MPP superfamily phosphohydrolase